MRFLKSMLWVATTLGLGALAYALMRAEGERGLRPVPVEPDDEPQPAPRTRPVARAAAARAEPPRCAALKKNGQRCTREPLEGSKYCWQHQ